MYCHIHENPRHFTYDCSLNPQKKVVGIRKMEIKEVSKRLEKGLNY